MRPELCEPDRPIDPARSTEPVWSVLFRDGSERRSGDGIPRFTFCVPTSRAFQYLLATDVYSAATAFIRGKVDVKGDLEAAIRFKGWQPQSALRKHLLGAIARCAAALQGGFQTGTQAARNIRFHYDRSNEFYRLFLDPRMVYSCAYFRSPDMTLEDAQVAKLNHICRKLDLQPGERFLDVGCGWGALIGHAAVQYGASYTFAKALGTQSDEFGGISGYFSPRQWNYGPLGDSSRTHSLVLNYSYNLPALRKKADIRPLGCVTDNWTWSGITTLVTGTPYMLTMSTTHGQDITGSSEGARPTVVGNVCSGPTGFNPAALARTPQGSFGNLGFDPCTGPGVNNWNMAFAKRFRLKSEERYLQVRAEMFNTFKHTQYSSLDTSVIFNPAGKNTDPSSGMYTAAHNPRIMELSVRIAF